MTQPLFLSLLFAALFCAACSVMINRTLHAILCQMLTAAALAGVFTVAGLRYTGIVFFALNILSGVLFLLFAVMTGEESIGGVPLSKAAYGLASIFLIAALIETSCFFYTSFGAADSAEAFSSPVFVATGTGLRLFVEKPFLICLFGALITVCIIGTAVLLTDDGTNSVHKNKEEE